MGALPVVAVVVSDVPLVRHVKRLQVDPGVQRSYPRRSHFGHSSTMPTWITSGPVLRPVHGQGEPPAFPRRRVEPEAGHVPVDAEGVRDLALVREQVNSKQVSGGFIPILPE